MIRQTKTVKSKEEIKLPQILLNNQFNYLNEFYNKQVELYQVTDEWYLICCQPFDKYLYLHKNWME